VSIIVRGVYYCFLDGSKKQLDVLDRNLATRQFLCGDEYNIADTANYAWYGILVQGKLYDAGEFLNVTS